MAGIKEAIKAMADAAVAVAEAQEVLGSLYEVRDRMNVQVARVDKIYDSTSITLDVIEPGVAEAVCLKLPEENS